MKISTEWFNRWVKNQKEKDDAKIRALSEWHRWFAWRPVNLKEGDWRWLEYVARYLDYRKAVGNVYKYKDLKEFESKLNIKLKAPVV